MASQGGLTDSGFSENREGQVKLPLLEFLEYFPPPCDAQLAHDCSNKRELQEYDLIPGSKLHFHRMVRSTLVIKFTDNEGTRHETELDSESKVRFHLLPYDPVSGDTRSEHVFHTVADLVEAFPLYVEAKKSWHNLDRPAFSFSAGSQFKLLRLLFHDGQKMLECRRLDEIRVMYLPMSCMGDFTVLPDYNDYTVAELLSMLPRKRRIQVIDDKWNQDHDIPGLPPNFSGDILVEEPELHVEVSSEQNPDVFVGVPTNLSMDILADPTPAKQELALNLFAQTHRSGLPVVARVTHWEEESSILENHFIQPGVELVIHGWTRQSKVLARAGEKYYSVPLTYRGTFCLKPKRFEGVAELEKAHPSYLLKVVENKSMEDVDLYVGDLVRVRREDTLRKGMSAMREMTHFIVDKLDAHHKVLKTLRLPVHLYIVFEEVNEDSRFSIKDLTHFVQDADVDVQLVNPSPDQRFRERDIPVGPTLTLTDNITESAVYCSVSTPESPAFHIPLRTLLYVEFIEGLEKTSSPLLMKRNPKLSTLDRCAEDLLPEVYRELQARVRAPGDGPRSPSISSPLSTPPTSAEPDHITQRPPYWPSNGMVTAQQPWSTASQYNNPDYAASTISVSAFDSASQVGKKSLASRIKSKFRKHKSTENIYRSAQQDPQLSMLPMQHASSTQDVFTRSQIDTSYPTFASVQDRVVSNLNDDTDTGISSYNSVQVRSNQSVNTADLESVNVNTNTLPEPPAEFKQNGHYSPSSVSNNSQEMPPLTPAGATVAITVHPENFERDQRPPKPQSTSTVMVNGQSGHSRPPAPLPQPAPAMVPASSVTYPQTAQVIGQPAPQPGNFALVCVQQPGQDQPSYMMVPVVQPIMQGGQAQQTVVSTGPGQGYEDTTGEDQPIPLSRTMQFNLVIPPDGNLYGFNPSRMADFLRQMRIDERNVQMCLKDKIDGKKFSRMKEEDLERYGLMHPVVLHFRRQTHKANSS